MSNLFSPFLLDKNGEYSGKTAMLQTETTNIQTEATMIQTKAAMIQADTTTIQAETPNIQAETPNIQAKGDDSDENDKKIPAREWRAGKCVLPRITSIQRNI